MQKNIISLFFLFLSFYISGQESNLDNYKYIVVSNKFHFVKEVDEYQTSSLTKFLLEKKGFQVFLSNEDFPEELSQNKCDDTLFADVIDDSDFLTTKSIIVLNDCKGKNIYTSKVGKSKLKDFKKSYQEAIRNAFKTMTDVVFSYKASEKKEFLVDKNTNFSNKKGFIKDSIIQKKVEIKEMPTEDVLYAQPILNGFQLVNTTPKVVFILQKTTIKDIFLVKNTSGIVYKDGNDWFFEYYNENELVKKLLQLKF